MKKIFSLLIIALFTSMAWAQTAPARVHPLEHPQPRLKWNNRDWGVSFQLNGLISNLQVNTMPGGHGYPAIWAKKAIKDDAIVRIGFGWQMYNTSASTVDSVGAYRIAADSSFSQNNLYLAFGYEKHFGGTKRLDPYVGAEIMIGSIGREKYNSEVITSDTTGSSTLEVIEEIPGGVNFGIALIAGANYFIAPKLALGAEYNWGFSSVVQGGDYSRVSILTPVAGNPITTREIGSDRSTANNLQMNGTALLTLTYFFSSQN